MDTSAALDQLSTKIVTPGRFALALLLGLIFGCGGAAAGWAVGLSPRQIAVLVIIGAGLGLALVF